MVDSAQGGTWVHFEFVYACCYKKDEGEGWAGGHLCWVILFVFESANDTVVGGENQGSLMVWSKRSASEKFFFFHFFLLVDVKHT